MKEFWGDTAIQKGWRFLQTVSKVGSVCTQRGTCDISTTYKCKIFPCFFPSLSVWAVTTCWSLLSRKTPACSVGVTDSPATVSRTASLYATCQLVRLHTHTARCFQPSHSSHQFLNLSLRYQRDKRQRCRFLQSEFVIFCNDWIYVSFTFQATTRCSSSLLEPPPSASEKRWPHATTSVTFWENKQTKNTLQLVHDSVQCVFWLYFVHTMTVTSMHGQQSRTCVVSTT